MITLTTTLTSIIVDRGLCCQDPTSAKSLKIGAEMGGNGSGSRAGAKNEIPHAVRDDGLQGCGNGPVCHSDERQRWPFIAGTEIPHICFA